MASAALTYALNNGISQAQYYKNIFDYVNNNRGLNDVQLRDEMDRLGVSTEDVAAATGVPLAGVQTRYNVADEVTPTVSADDAYRLYTQARGNATQGAQSLLSFTNPNGSATQESIDRANAFQAEAGNRALAQAGYSLDQNGNLVPSGSYVAQANIPVSVGVTSGLNNNMTQAQIDKNIFDFINANRGLNDVQLAAEMDRLGISPNDVARATGVSYESVAGRYNAAKTGNVGGANNTAITDIFNQYVTPTGTGLITGTNTVVGGIGNDTIVGGTNTVVGGTGNDTVVGGTSTIVGGTGNDTVAGGTGVVTFNPATIAQPTVTAGQMRELFPSFAESKRLAGAMVAGRPSTQSIINMIQGGSAVATPTNTAASTVRPTSTVTAPVNLMDAWRAAESSGNYGAVANLLRGVTTADLRNYGASPADIAYITSRPQIAGMFPTTAGATTTPSLNNVLSMISK
jgi:hypothetical protein